MVSKENVIARHNLGILYTKGRGVDRKAVEWWQKAAEQGHAASQIIWEIDMLKELELNRIKGRPWNGI